MITTHHDVDIDTAEGRIRTFVVRPAGGGRFPAVLLYSDVFQLTASTKRMATRLAGHGYVVVMPQIFARITPAGTGFDFDRERDAALAAMAGMRVQWHDEDRAAVLAWIAQQPFVTDDVLCCGFCIGGHLAFRAACDPAVHASVCFYGTGIHSGGLGADADAGSLARAADIHGELLLVWGRQDPHIPEAGRHTIHKALEDAGVRYEARHYDAQHAFMRDEGPRFDPAATDDAFAAMLAMFSRTCARRAAARETSSP